MKKNLIIFKILILLLSLFSLSPNFFKIDDFVIKGMYIAFIILVIQCYINDKIIIPDRRLTIFVLLSVLFSLLSYKEFGIDRNLINYIFGFILIGICLSSGKNIKKEEWERIFCYVWTGLFILIVINNLTQIDKFIYYFEVKLDHPYINTVCDGGVNLEASWLGILSVFFFRYKYLRYIPLILSFFISVLYSSRVGVIANLCVLFIFLYGYIQGEKLVIRNKKRLCITFLFFISIPLLIVILLNSNIAIVDRFVSIGKESGSMGRIRMWMYIPQLIIKYPFGCGLGNVMEALHTVSPLIYTEGNIHNLFLQMFCEIGICGGMYFLYLCMLFVKKEIFNFINNPIASSIMIFGILCLFQYDTIPTIMYVIISSYIITSNQNDGRCKKIPSINLSR